MWGQGIIFSAVFRVFDRFFLRILAQWVPSSGGMPSNFAESPPLVLDPSVAQAAFTKLETRPIVFEIRVLPASATSSRAIASATGIPHKLFIEPGKVAIQRIIEHKPPLGDDEDEEPEEPPEPLALEVDSMTRFVLIFFLFSIDCSFFIIFDCFFCFHCQGIQTTVSPTFFSIRVPRGSCFVRAKAPDRATRDLITLLFHRIARNEPNFAVATATPPTPNSAATPPSKSRVTLFDSDLGSPVPSGGRSLEQVTFFALLSFFFQFSASKTFSARTCFQTRFKSS
jgi:hypothetical protein